ncbi:MAG: hypothetical protein R3C52_10090 [Hyphomonadaceae bacterium]
MRTAIAILFAIVALASAGVWALLQYGLEPEIAAEESVLADASDLEAAAPPPAPPEAVVEAAPDVAADVAAESAIEAAKAGAMVREAAPSPSALETLALDEDGESDLESRGLEVRTQSVTTAAEEASAAPAPQPTAPSLEDRFKSREVAYNRPPKTLALGRSIDVSLTINATDQSGAGADSLQGFPGEIVERDVDLSDVVSAQLTGVGFDITTQSVQRQKLSDKVVNRWQWRVTPTEEGTRTLILEIFGYANGSPDAEPLDQYRDDITVEVKQLDRIITWARGAQPVFAVAAGAAGVLSALFAFLRFREEKKRNV